MWEKSRIRGTQVASYVFGDQNSGTQFHLVDMKDDDDMDGVARAAAKIERPVGIIRVRLNPLQKLDGKKFNFHVSWNWVPRKADGLSPFNDADLKMAENVIVYIARASNGTMVLPDPKTAMNNFLESFVVPPRK
jgi:hypothetical protein